MNKYLSKLALVAVVMAGVGVVRADQWDKKTTITTDETMQLPNMTLQQHHQLTRDHMLQRMENSSAADPVSVTIDGHPALQDEVSGTQSRTPLTFLHTTVDEGDSFQQVLAWTLKSRWHKHNEELRSVTNSFHSEE